MTRFGDGFFYGLILGVVLVAITCLIVVVALSHLRWE